MLVTLLLCLAVAEIILKIVLPEVSMNKRTIVKKSHNTIYVDTQGDTYSTHTPFLRFEGKNRDIILHHKDFSSQYCKEKKKDNSFRIIFIGDSVTESISIVEGHINKEIDIRYSDLLYEKLNSNKTLNKHFEILNFAVGGETITLMKDKHL